MSEFRQDPREKWTGKPIKSQQKNTKTAAFGKPSCVRTSEPTNVNLDASVLQYVFNMVGGELEFYQEIKNSFRDRIHIGRYRHKAAPLSVHDDSIDQRISFLTGIRYRRTMLAQPTSHTPMANRIAVLLEQTPCHLLPRATRAEPGRTTRRCQFFHLLFLLFRPTIEFSEDFFRTSQIISYEQALPSSVTSQIR